MRIAVLSDVHGNLRALEAVTDDLRRQAPDLVVHGGELVLNGPRPAEVVDRIRELGWPGARVSSPEGLDARLVVYSHLHRPFVRRIGSLTVANTGSVGWPVDGDWRPSYLLIDDGEVGAGGGARTRPQAASPSEVVTVNAA